VAAARRRAQKWRKIAIASTVIIVVSLVVGSNLLVGYEMVNGSSLKILSVYFAPGTSSTIGNILVDAELEFTGRTDWDSPKGLQQIGDPTYSAMLNETPTPVSACFTDRIYITPNDFISCNLMIANVSLTGIAGSSLTITYTGIVHYYLYYERVTLSDSMALGTVSVI